MQKVFAENNHSVVKLPFSWSIEVGYQLSEIRGHSESHEQQLDDDPEFNQRYASSTRENISVRHAETLPESKHTEP